MVTCSAEKELFLAACQAEECQSFLEFMEKHKSKSDDFNISDLLLSVSRKQQEKLWDGLFELCARTMAKLNPSADPVEQSTLDDVLKCLQGIVTVGTCCLSTEKPVIVDKMLETMTVLHGVLLDLPDSASKLQHNIAKLCHSWWNDDLPGRELLVPNTIMYLLVKTLQPSGMVSDVRLLYSMRKSFSQLNLADESSTSLKELLEQCFINSIFLKNDDGRKFLSFLLCLDCDLTERLHSAIKNQLPSCPKNTINYYGEVYFKAWRKSTPPLTAKLETSCIQDLMHSAVHARRVGTRNLSLTLRQLLSYFTKQKRQQGVDSMLLTLYEPILWRAFKVANSSVRANAAALLIDAFPLQDPEANKEETDALLQKQIDILQGFLTDQCPVLRVTGVQGVCRILGMYWELIPAHVLTAFLTKLIQDMAFDTSSSDVRVSVFKGLMFVIDNPLSHPLLKNLLPSLKNFIHDTSEKVIVAFVDLLIKVKGLKTIKVWSIVPVEDLLARLEVDSPPVSRRIVNLLFKSFQPTDRDASVQIERVMALICMNPGAARVFYQYAHKHMSVDTAADFMLLLSRCLRGCINQEEHHNSMMSAGGDNSTEEEEEEEREGLSLKDTDVIDGMLEIIVILWTGIAQQLAKPVNQSVMQKLVHRFGKDLPRFLATFKDGRSLSAVLILVSFLPASSIPAFSHSCLSKLKSMDPTASPEAYSPLIQCLISWGKGNDVIRLLSDWLELAINQTDNEKESEEEEEESGDQMSSKLKKKRVTFNEPVVKPQPRLAMAYLDWLLTNYSCRTLLLDTSAKPLREMAAILKGVLPLIEKRLMNPGPLSDMMSDDMLTSIVHGYCRVIIHLQSLQSSEPSSPSASELSHVSSEFDELLAWCDRELLSVLPQSSGEESSAKADDGIRKLAKDCLMVVLKFACDVVTLGLGSDVFYSHLADFCHLVLKTEDNMDFVSLVAKIMCHLGRGGLAMDDKQQDLVADLFTKFIKAIGITASQKEKDTSQMQQALSSIKPAVSDILRNSSKCNVRFHDDVLASSMAACVGEMTNTVAQSEGTLDAVQSAGDLPPVSSFLVGIVSSNKDLLRSFVYELERCVSVGALQTFPTLLAAFHILHPLSQDKKRGGSCGIKECLTALRLQMDKLQPSKDQDEEDDGPNDPNRFMFGQMQSLEKQISEAIGGVA
ncbi:condensin-2 complex subunit G2-like [Lytechinus variegatus]|uniref:condensin-2 complex subunit G2-like n=1 Tax=Lytechinus variegatus TaxID=7654 RepID=UPI001BB2BD95|nr:condensin-2 complex subunit G2-like [Lytechinus variegatus]XP_041457705.1 condensin-2 complex subunit G2-like [Lytechinus variegatus]